MKYNKFVVLLLLLCSSFSIAQDTYEYLGFIKLNGSSTLNNSSIISYNISFSVQNGKLTGHSLTDLGGLHETKSNITGTYDAQKKEFEFKEYGVLYTKSPITQDNFCFVNYRAEGVNLKINYTMSGRFKGFFSNNIECVSGEIFFSRKNKIEEIEKIAEIVEIEEIPEIEKIEKIKEIVEVEEIKEIKEVKEIEKIEKVSEVVTSSKKVPNNVKENIGIVKKMDTLKMNILKKNETLSVFSRTKEVRFEVFDGGKLDGDRISVTSNGKSIINNYTISFKRKIVPITLKSKKTSIILTALNTGEIGTNTAVIELFVNNNTKVRALTNLKKGETTKIDLFLADFD